MVPATCVVIVSNTKFIVLNGNYEKNYYYLFVVKLAYQILLSILVKIKAP